MAEEITAAPPASAAPPTSYASDLIPPQITVLSPLQGSIIDTDAPLIEILVEDPGSDIALNTIRLILDRMDITAPATIKRLNGPEQAPVSPYKISYLPSASLKEGIHEIYFSVRDKAGNLAEHNWTFQVEFKINWGIRVSGSNTLQFNLLQVNEAMDSLDLTVQGQYQDTDIQLHLFGRATNSPGITPLFSYEDYNFYLDSYSLGIYQQRFGLVLGYTGVALDSELFQNSLDKGWVAGDTIETTTGQYNWVAFSGETANASGLNIEIDKINGLTGRWSAATGWGVGGFYVRLDGEYGSADFIDIKGNSPYGKPVLFRYEVIHGDSKTDGVSQAGNGVALHLDKPIGTSVIGFDYMMFESDYPAFNFVPVTPADGGVQKYAIRSSTPFGKGQNINFNISVSKNNLDQSVCDTTHHDNINIGYNLNPDPNFSFNANYQWDFQYPYDITTNYLSLAIRRASELSAFQNSLSLGKTNSSDPNQANDFYNINSAWIRTIGLYNLTPSINWSNNICHNGSHSTFFEAHVALDRQFHPEVGRSGIYLYQKYEEIVPVQTYQRKYTTGLTSVIYLKTWRNSTLTLYYDCSRWIKEDPGSDGWDQTLSLTWKSLF